MSNIHGFIAFFAYCLENSTSCHLKRQMVRDKWYLMIWNGKMFETNSIKSLQLLKLNLDQAVNESLMTMRCGFWSFQYNTKIEERIPGSLAQGGGIITLASLKETVSTLSVSD